MTLTPCPICRTPGDPRLLLRTDEWDATVVAFVSRQTPSWSPAHGICPACLQRYSGQYAVGRSLTSLHTQTDPITTFPFYHPAEETVLSQEQRLPSYATFGGRNVTIAFLDSGYYPHPDFLRSAQWPGVQPDWRLLSEVQWRRLLAAGELRFVHYVDLTDGGEQRGLDTSSLWDGAGDSWHGQMTTAIAAGNGLLSGGRYRGYAPQASILPIKIGRGGGRIPEEDILHGLNWLLKNDNWQRFGVRVVNISVGGDFPQPWADNAVCRAADALTQRGVLVAAAAGNRGVEELLAPAQTPSVLTVGGVDDQNLRWRSPAAGDLRHFALYHHNYGSVAAEGTRDGGSVGPHGWQRKPELLAPARWLPAPILPPSPIFHEAFTIGRLRQVLQGEDEQSVQRLHGHWQHAVHGRAGAASHPQDHEMMPEVWHALRRSMNAHKWVHPYYQHVDGTSVAVAQVSAVAAQMFAANPALSGGDVRRLLLETAQPLAHFAARRAGAGLLQPAMAVAAALRASGGVLSGFPRSGSRLCEHELQKWTAQGTLAVLALEEPSHPANTVYFGCYAPDAAFVSLTGSFNQWLPDRLPLRAAGGGWWHVAISLPAGAHTYRFWVASAQEEAAAAVGQWRRDYENPFCSESGYWDGHSVVVV